MVALRQQLEDLALALRQLRLGAAGIGHQQHRGERRVDERLVRRDCADRAEQVVRRRALHHIPARARGDGVRDEPPVAVCREDDELDLGRFLVDALDC